MQLGRPPVNLLLPNSRPTKCCHFIQQSVNSRDGEFSPSFRIIVPFDYLNLMIQVHWNTLTTNEVSVSITSSQSETELRSTLLESLCSREERWVATKISQYVSQCFDQDQNTPNLRGCQIGEESVWKIHRHKMLKSSRDFIHCNDIAIGPCILTSYEQRRF